MPATNLAKVARKFTIILHSREIREKGEASQQPSCWSGWWWPVHLPPHSWLVGGWGSSMPVDFRVPGVICNCERCSHFIDLISNEDHLCR